MLQAVGKARLTWGVTIGGLGAIPASVCAGYDPGLRREDRIHSSRYPAAPPLQPCSPATTSAQRAGGDRLRLQLPQGQMKGPAASGQSLRSRPVRPQDGGRGRESSLLPTALGITASRASGSATSGPPL